MKNDGWMVEEWQLNSWRMVVKWLKNGGKTVGEWGLNGPEGADSLDCGVACGGFGYHRHRGLLQPTLLC